MSRIMSQNYYSVLYTQCINDIDITLLCVFHTSKHKLHDVKTHLYIFRDDFKVRLLVKWDNVFKFYQSIYQKSCDTVKTILQTLYRNLVVFLPLFSKIELFCLISMLTNNYWQHISSGKWWNIFWRNFKKNFLILNH